MSHRSIRSASLYCIQFFVRTLQIFQKALLGNLLKNWVAAYGRFRATTLNGTELSLTYWTWSAATLSFLVFSFLSFLFFYFFSGSCQEAGILECPRWFKNNKSNLIYCTINTTAITEAGCGPLGTTITFFLLINNNLPAPLCDESLTICTTKYNTGNCRCVSHISDLKRYEFNFVANSSIHANASLDCDIVCLSHPVQLSVEPSCKRLDFGKSLSVCVSVSLDVKIQLVRNCLYVSLAGFPHLHSV